VVQFEKSPKTRAGQVWVKPVEFQPNLRWFDRVRFLVITLRFFASYCVLLAFCLYNIEEHLSLSFKEADNMLTVNCYYISTCGLS
jgi:ATP/ADP translocase